MSWELGVVLGLYAFAAVGTILGIGKPREPQTPGAAATGLVLTGFVVYLVLRIAGVL